MCRARRNGVHVSEVDYVIDGGSDPLPELPNSEPNEVDRAVGRQIVGRDRGWRLPADRHRRHAQRGVQRIAGERVEGPRRADRDADRRHHRPLPAPARSPMRARQLHPGKTVFTFGLGRKTLYDTVHRNAGFPEPAGGRDQPAAHHHAERQCGVDQQHDEHRPHGAGGLRVRRAPAHLRHRRPGAVRARGLCLEGRQVLRVPCVHL